jgi:hypothetical protein
MVPRDAEASKSAVETLVNGAARRGGLPLWQVSLLSRSPGADHPCPTH